MTTKKPYYPFQLNKRNKTCSCAHGVDFNWKQINPGVKWGKKEGADTRKVSHTLCNYPLLSG